jgi:hypothetical protein
VPALTPAWGRGSALSPSQLLAGHRPPNTNTNLSRRPPAAQHLFWSGLRRRSRSRSRSIRQKAPGPGASLLVPSPPRLARPCPSSPSPSPSSPSSRTASSSQLAARKSKGHQTGWVWHATCNHHHTQDLAVLISPVYIRPLRVTPSSAAYADTDTHIYRQTAPAPSIAIAIAICKFAHFTSSSHLDLGVARSGRGAGAATFPSGDTPLVLRSETATPCPPTWAWTHAISELAWRSGSFEAVPKSGRLLFKGIRYATHHMRILPQLR